MSIAKEAPMATLEPPQSEQPGKRARTKQANRDAILEAAKQVFAEMSYGGATVRDIIRRTGLASGTFYNYFKSKEEVFEALMDANAQTIRPLLRQVRQEAPDFPGLIRNSFKAYFEFIVKNRAGYAVIRRNAGTVRMRLETPEIVAGFDELREDLDAAIKAGLVPAVDTAYLTAALAGVAFEVGDVLLRGDPPDVEKAARFAASLFLGGIAALPVDGK